MPSEVSKITKYTGTIALIRRHVSQYERKGFFGAFFAKNKPEAEIARSVIDLLTTRIGDIKDNKSTNFDTILRSLTALHNSRIISETRSGKDLKKHILTAISVLKSDMPTPVRNDSRSLGKKQLTQFVLD